jgi:uncharacterized membrane protein
MGLKPGPVAGSTLTDLIGLVVFTVILDASLLLSIGSGSPLLFIPELVLVLFLPGYAFVAALFPGTDGTGGFRSEDTGISALERVAFSFVLSVALVACTAFVLNNTPWGIRRLPLIGAVTAVILLGTAVATLRRFAVAPENRFEIDVRRFIGAVLPTLKPDHWSDVVITVLLVFGIVVAGSSIMFVAGTPTSDERYTELYLLTEDDNGELVARNYPREVPAGDERSVFLRVHNNEHREMTYSVVVERQTLTGAGNDTIEATGELHRSRPGTLAHNASWTREYTISPTVDGAPTRLVFLLYAGTAPDDPATDSAYRSVHLRMNVSA